MDKKLEDKLNGNFISIKARTYLAAAIFALSMAGYGCGTVGGHSSREYYSRDVCSERDFDDRQGNRLDERHNYDRH